MSDDLKQLEDKYIAQLENIDEMALLVLKGHLLIEEIISRIIEKFVFHPESIQAARLGFAQKVLIARSMSLDENDNSMWNMIDSINSLRNELAHALESPKRAQKIERLKSNFIAEVREHSKYEELKGSDEIAIASLSIGLSLGFLFSFEKEIDRFKGFVNIMDYVANPHRREQNNKEK